MIGTKRDEMGIMPYLLSYSLLHLLFPSLGHYVQSPVPSMQQLLQRRMELSDQLIDAISRDDDEQIRALRRERYVLYLTGITV